jgi:ABC-type transport system substrate-binding protein
MSTVSVYLNQNSYVGKNAYTIDKETTSDPKERVDEATGMKSITTTYTSYRTYYNNMSQEDYDKLHPKNPYTEITNKDFNKDYTYMGTKTTTEIKVDENGEKVLYISEYREYRYTITTGKGLNAVKVYHVDTPFGVKIFQNEGVRKALSMVIDRNAIAEKVVYAKAANALVPYGVFNTNRKDSFREVGGSIISTSPASVAEAKALIPAEIVPEDYEIQLTVEANDAVHCIVAENVAEAWRALGFRVIVEKVDAEVNNEVGSTGEVSTDIRDNVVIESIYNRTFQATVVDLVAPTVRAYSILAPFAKDFAGTAMNMNAKGEDGQYLYEIEGHITGYNNDEYNALIEQAFAEKDKAKQAELLHQAEEMLLEDMPIIPVIFNQDAYVISGELSKVSSSYFANRIFTKTKLKDYEKYLETSAS